MRSSVIIDQHRRKEVRMYEAAVRDRKALRVFTNVAHPSEDLRVSRGFCPPEPGVGVNIDTATIINKFSTKTKRNTSGDNNIEAVKGSAMVSLTRLRPRSTQVRRRCVATGRGRGVLRRFRLSRIKARESVLRGELACARKRTW